MAKKTLYHGTTLDNFEDIVEYGFGKGIIISNWNCSDPFEF